MRSLKILVVVLGVLLVAGVVGLGFAVSYRLNHPRPVAPAVVSGGTGGTAIVVDLPPGAKIHGTKVSGDRLVVRVTLETSEEILVFNLETGARVATIELRPGGETEPGVVPSPP